MTTRFAAHLASLLCVAAPSMAQRLDSLPSAPGLDLVIADRQPDTGYDLLRLQDDRDPVQGPPAEAQKVADRGFGGTVPIGFGVTADPKTLQLGGAVDLPLAPNWTVGPALQVGFTDERFLVAPTLQVKRHFGLGPLHDKLTPCSVFAACGIGFVYLERDLPRRGDAEDTGLLFEVGGGFRYRLSDRVSLGTQVMAHAMPGGVLGEHSYFSWDALQVILHF